jgi:hypothetical protein
MSDLRPGIVAVFKNICLFLASVMLGLLLCEVIVRAFFPQHINPHLVRDSGFGIRDNQPNTLAHHLSPGEYRVDISTNSDGLRGAKNYDRTTYAGTRRIAILGDSYAFGYGCNDDQVVSAVLENALNGAPPVAGRKWEVLNFGVSGYGQSEELILYRNKTRLYRPDTVILFYFENDIGNNVVANTFAIGKDGLIESTGKSYLPGTATEQWMYSVPPLRWFFLYSQFWNLLRNQLSALVQRHSLDQVGLKSYNDGNTYGVALTRALLLALRREVEGDGARFIVFIVPDNDDPNTSNFPFTRTEWQTLGINVVDGRNVVDRSDYFARDGHWRPSGHQKAALTLKPMLLEEDSQVPNSYIIQHASVSKGLR